MNDPAKRESNFDSFMYKLSNGDYNINKYDLIILDLRLYEKSTHNSTDILDIKNISGNKILDFLKRTSPALPVIMCTASNKFWSYNMARNFGADGFWSKESPQYGVAFDYQFYNTYNFIKMTYSVMKWSSNIRPIYEALEEIASSIDNKQISERIKYKLNAVFSQLHISRSKFIENQFGQSGLTTAYLAVHSLVNEVLDLKNIRKDKSYFVELSGKEIKFCIKEENKFNLTEEVINQLKILKKYRYYQGSNIFPDRDFINYVLQKSGNGELRKNYNQYNWIRNNLPIIHRRKSKTHNIKITLKDLMGYLAIFYRIFLNKECKFLIYKK